MWALAPPAPPVFGAPHPPDCPVHELVFAAAGLSFRKRWPVPVYLAQGPPWTCVGVSGTANLMLYRHRPSILGICLAAAKTLIERASSVPEDPDLGTLTHRRPKSLFIPRPGPATARGSRPRSSRFSSVSRHRAQSCSRSSPRAVRHRTRCRPSTSVTRNPASIGERRRGTQHKDKERRNEYEYNAAHLFQPPLRFTGK